MSCLKTTFYKIKKDLENIPRMIKMKKQYQKYYVLKCDIRKYFYSIDKEILFDTLKEKIKDKKLLNFTKILLNDNDKIGIPIGNYTSQYFANIYLNDFDHYVKDTLKVKYYVRYMDDFILLIPTSKEAKKIKENINQYIEEKLHLKLNQKSKYYTSKLSIDFCGYKIYETR